MRARTFGLLVVLTVLWIALWEGPSTGNVIAGVAVAGLVLRLVPAAHTAAPIIRPLAAVRFFVVFVVKLIQANAVVAWEVITPWSRVREGIVAVPLRSGAPGLRTLVANSVSLTPGTLSLDVDPDNGVLYVHVLHLEDAATTRRDVLHLEMLAVAAFGTLEDRATLAGAGGSEP